VLSWSYHCVTCVRISGMLVGEAEVK